MTKTDTKLTPHTGQGSQGQQDTAAQGPGEEQGGGKVEGTEACSEEEGAGGGREEAGALHRQGRRDRGRLGSGGLGHELEVLFLRLTLQTASLPHRAEAL